MPADPALQFRLPNVCDPHLVAHLLVIPYRKDETNNFIYYRETLFNINSFPNCNEIYIFCCFVYTIFIPVLQELQPLHLNNTGEYLRVVSTGLLWGIGNYSMLLLVEQIGTGRGFTISQLGVVVSGLIGVFFLKDPHPRSRAAVLTLIGCVFATIGGILLGSLK